jgi:hypothetical protein
MQVRHFGFLALNFSVGIQKIRELISLLYELLRAQPVPADPPKKPKPLRCGRCQGVMKWIRFIPPIPLNASP